MPRLTRYLQAAVRKAQQNGRGGASPLEKLMKQTNNELYRQLGIPNAIRMGQGAMGQPPKDRGYAATATPGWPSLGLLGQALDKVAWQGSILEICSPGHQSRDVASQLAAWKATSSRVLWLSVEPPQAEDNSRGTGLPESPNLTLRRWPIATPADSSALLKHLLQEVRSQHYSMVVLDTVLGLVPPPPGAAALPGPSLGDTTTARLAPVATGAPDSAAQAAAAAAEGSAAAAAAGQATVEHARKGAAAPRQAAAAVPAGLEAAASLAVAAGLSGARTAAGAASQELTVGVPPLAKGKEGAGLAPAGAAAARRGLWAAPASMGRERPPVATPVPVPGPAPNFKFLHNVLPMLLEVTLAELAASCGPELATTTLLLNSYSRQPGQDWLASSSQRSSSVDRSRCARRAITRHACGTLHLLPEERSGPATASGAPTEGQSRGGSCSMHVELTRGLPSGEDGSVLFKGSLGPTARHALQTAPDAVEP